MNTVSLERGLVFDCKGQQLCGILHPADQATTQGVLLVVGGPQYRVGSHRQFVLLARALAAQGIPVLRFDYRGMGDSEGELRDFEAVSEDIEAAIDRFQSELPAIKRVTIWGLCDAASAAAFYGWQDPRVSALVLLNPWVRTDAGEARVYLKHYYLQRLLQGDFWRKLLRLKWNPLDSLGSLWCFFRQAVGGASTRSVRHDMPAGLGLPQRMLFGLQRFEGPVLLILSGRDLTAQEFKDLTASDTAWSSWLAGPEVERRDLAEADHTFSSRVWRDQVAQWTVDWIKTQA